MNAVVISNQNAEVIYTVSTDAKEIEFAGAVAADGSPVNVSTHRVSRSKVNLAEADKRGVGGLVQRAYNGSVFYVRSSDAD